MKWYDIFKFSSSDIYALKFLYSLLPIFLVVVVVGKGGGGGGGGGGAAPPDSRRSGILFKFCKLVRLVFRPFFLNQNRGAFFQKLEFDTPSHN